MRKSAKRRDGHFHVLLSRKRLVFLRWDGWLPQIDIHEKYEKTVRWTLRLLTAFGVGVNFLSLPWFYAGPVAVALVLVEQFLERTMFLYTSIYLRPIGFEAEPGKWEAMSYVFATDEKTREPSFNAVGLVFSDAEYAVRLFDFLKSWNGGEKEDVENNIQLSFITDEERYYVFLFPRPKSRVERRFFAKVKRSQKFASYGKEHVGLTAFQMFYKSFDTMAAGYALGDFVKKQKRGDFYLVPVAASGGILGMLHPDHWITKKHYKSKNRFELTEDDFELLLWRHLRLD